MARRRRHTPDQIVRPCGYLGDARRPCRCSPRGRDRYARRLSGPLLDRFDMRVMVGRLGVDELAGPGGESSAVVRERVGYARLAQRERGALNRDLGRDLLDATAWEPEGLDLLRAAASRFGLTGRGWDRVRRVARTVADLAGFPVVGEAHVAEALSYRGDW